MPLVDYYLIAPETHLFEGDCLEVLQRESVRRELAADLIIWDPPYGIGQKYADCSDTWPSFERYLEWLQAKFVTLVGYLAENGSLWLVLPPRAATYMWVYAEARGLRVVNNVTWHYRFAQHRSDRFIPSKTALLWMCRAKAAPWFDLDAVMVESDRKRVYDDKRIEDSPRKGMRAPLDVWLDFPRVQGTNAERCTWSPNQLPELLVARIIKACSRPGDLVLDPMMGSGTVPTVARRLGRPSIGIDVSQKCVINAYGRVLRGPVRELSAVSSQQSARAEGQGSGGGEGTEARRHEGTETDGERDARATLNPKSSILDPCAAGGDA